MGEKFLMEAWRSSGDANYICVMTRNINQNFKSCDGIPSVLTDLKCGIWSMRFLGFRFDIAMIWRPNENEKLTF
ncbi:hypothetical protein H5410_051488 [Solanum commersonii]|uniref:Uncharacterized protein n=1 Tax=Solanum commersonii TaxID=4109 RepID=A0A9J5X055_SOLCO|nr:hypothetical protein H5410_051488 [Solanum commersonii]